MHKVVFTTSRGACLDHLKTGIEKQICKTVSSADIENSVPGRLKFSKIHELKIAFLKSGFSIYDLQYYCSNGTG